MNKPTAPSGFRFEKRAITPNSFGSAPKASSSDSNS